MTHLSYSRTYATTPESAYDSLIHVSLPDVLGHRSLVIPGIREVRVGPTGWARSVTSGPSSSTTGRPRAKSWSWRKPPHQFGYRITELHGSAGPSGGIHRRPRLFVAEGSGTTITWSWNLHPRGLQGRVAMLTFGPMWRRWAVEPASTALENLLATSA